MSCVCPTDFVPLNETVCSPPLDESSCTALGGQWQSSSCLPPPLSQCSPPWNATHDQTCTYPLLSCDQPPLQTSGKLITGKRKPFFLRIYGRISFLEILVNLKVAGRLSLFLRSFLYHVPIVRLRKPGIVVKQVGSRQILTIAKTKPYSQRARHYLFQR